MGVSVELAQRARARVGQIVCNKWRIERVLGVGGMATVYAAVHHNQNRVALKMLHPEVAVDEYVKVRFLREGYAANTVDHPGAVRVFDNDTSEDGVAFLVMELLDGESLENRALRLGPVLPLPEVLALMDQLLDVLAAAHDKGIVHRDVKPDNLMLTTAGRLKVLDFGIACLREMSTPQSSVTGAGSFMGTPAFMAPEQARGRWSEVDERSDLWAVGATMFALLTGGTVHEAETINDQLVLAATTPAPSITLVREDLPHAVAALVDRALAFDKADRWPDARAMQAALQEIAADVPFAKSFSVPRISIALDTLDREADTIAASADALEQITGNARSPTTAPAVTSSRSGEPTQAPRSRRWLGAVVGAAAIAAVGAVAFGMGQHDRAAATVSPGAEPSAPAARAPMAPVPTPEPSAQPVPAPVVTPDETPPATASAAPRRHPVVHRPAPAAPAPAKTKPAPAPAAPAADLYDKRY